MDRPRRNLKRINYKDMANGDQGDLERDLLEANSSEEEGIISDSDSDKENEGSEADSGEESEQEVENGNNKEVEWLAMSEDEFESEFKKAKEEQNFELLESMLNIKEKRCELLQTELNREQEEESKKKKRKMKEIEERFKKLKRTESNLSKSLASSKNNTPQGSPKKKSSPSCGKAGKAKKHDKPKVVSTKKSKSPNKGRLNQAASQAARGEFDNINIFNKAGSKNKDRFNELMAQALYNSSKMPYMPGFDQVLRDVNSGLDNKFEAVENKFDTGKVEGRENFKIKEKESISGSQVLIDVNSQAGQNQLLEVLRKLSAEAGLFKGVKESSKCECSNASKENMVADPEGSTTGGKNDKKLVSGRITKPDESDIKKQVKYAHEKLDPRHVKDRVFDKLDFPLLIAGELELASRPEISMEERVARVEIAKTLCYHKLYLNDEDLRTGYDSVLKTVEQGQEVWSSKLASNLNNHLEFRANVAWREKIDKVTNGNKKKDSVSDTSKSDLGSVSEEAEPKLIYCMDFNKGICSNQKSHYGKWKGKKLMKWHVCKACLKNSEIKNHAEKDCKSQSKA